MGKTIRHNQFNPFRKPKGHKKAKINNARPGAVPPSDWDDVCHSRSNVFYKIAQRMAKKGADVQTIAQAIVTKTRKAKNPLRYSEALEYAVDAVEIREEKAA